MEKPAFIEIQAEKGGLEERKAYLKDFLEVQKEIPEVPKKGKGQHGKYATLDDIQSVLRPIISNHGIVVTQPVTTKGVITKIEHVESGYSIEYIFLIDPKDMRGQNFAQNWGQVITYMCRYSLASIFLIPFVEDKDVNYRPQPSGTQVHKPSSSQSKFTPVTQDQISVLRKIQSVQNLPEEIAERFKKVDITKLSTEKAAAAISSWKKYLPNEDVDSQEIPM